MKCCHAGTPKLGTWDNHADLGIMVYTHGCVESCPKSDRLCSSSLAGHLFSGGQM